MYFWINKECKSDQIVVNVDADDGVIGFQPFKIINAVYQNPQVWFAYSRYILTKTKDDQQIYDNGYSAAMAVSALSYRNQYTRWDISHLRTFRKKLFSKIPLQMMIEYHIDPTQRQYAYPSFYSYAFDTFQIFSMLEMTGDEHYKFITDYLYLYNGTGSYLNPFSCEAKHEKYDDFKCRIKTPLAKLNSLDDQAQQIMGFIPPEKTWKTLGNIHGRYKSCLDSLASGD